MPRRQSRTESAPSDGIPHISQFRTEIVEDLLMKRLVSIFAVMLLIFGIHSIGHAATPEFTDGDSTTRSVVENTPADVNIGDPVVATDADNDPLTYSLGGTDEASFSIDSETGQLKTNADLNHDTKSAYTVTVTVSDGNGNEDTITVTISVNVNTEVTIPDAALRAKIASALNKQADDPITAAEMATLTYFSAAYNISDLTGLEFATNLTAFHLWYSSVSNLSPLAGLTKLTKIQIRYSSVSNLSPLEDLTNLTSIILVHSSISDISPLKDLTKLTSLTLFANSISSISTVAKLTNLGYLNLHTNSIFDISAVAKLTKLTSLIVSTNSISDISAVEGLTNLTLLYLGGNPLSYASLNTHIPPLQSRGVTVNFDTRTATTLLKISGDYQPVTPGTPLANPFVVQVRDQDNKVFVGVPVTFTITVGGGSLSTTSTTTDANGKAESTLTLGSTPGKNTVSVSAIGIQESVIFNTQTPTAPTFTADDSTTREVEENTAADQNIGDPVTATDDDDGDILTYSLSGTDAASFDIDSGTGQLKTKAALDYETKNSYTVTVTVSDTALTDTITVTINVTDVKESPTFPSETTTRSIAENTAEDTNIGTPVEATDDDEGDTLTYTLGGTDAASFDIDSEIGQLKTKAALDYETKNSYTVTVTVSDTALTDTITVTINVTDVKESPTNSAPVFSDGTSTIRSIAENTAEDTNIGTPVEATDDDEGDTLTYTLGGTDAASFDIDSETGQLKTKAALDYETKNSYTVTVTVSDSGLTNTITVTINVSDVTEVNIPDPNLRAKIETALNKQAGHPISAEEMATLTSFDARTPNVGNLTISNLTGLEHATNLTYLKLQNNSISDISAVVGLTNLTYLNLQNNSISNISPVVGLTNLTKLYLQNNSISDISAVEELTNLTILYFYDNSISNISAVEELTNLTSLSIGGNSISDISALVGLTNLTSLNLYNNSISDISALARLTNLTNLFLRNNSISDISPLVTNTGLGSGDLVNVQGNLLSYPSIYTHIPTLTGRGVTVSFDIRTPTTLLKISDTITESDNLLVVQVRDSEGQPFAGVPVTFTVTAGGGTLSATSTTTNADGRAESTLTLGTHGTNTVSASAEGISQTVTFSDVPEATVDVPDTNLRATIETTLNKQAGAPITAADMANLNTLTAWDTNISNLTGLEHATNLTSLNLSNNSISNISAMEGLTNLTSLILSQNLISDISALDELTNLTYLALNSNSISDISAVAALTNLTQLFLGGNSISNISAVSGLTNLTQLGLVLQLDIRPLTLGSKYGIGEWRRGYGADKSPELLIHPHAHPNPPKQRD